MLYRLSLKSVGYRLLGSCTLLLALVLLVFPSYSFAAAKVVFLPLKVNAPATETARLSVQADSLLAKELKPLSGTLLSRNKAEGIVDYQTGWPPSFADLKKAASVVGAGYAGYGNLSKIGDNISIDLTIYDSFDSANVYRFHQSGRADELPVVMAKAVKGVSVYKNREGVVGSIEVVGNKLIDSAAILSKVTTKSGDVYDPEALHNDLKLIFAMGYFDDISVDVSDSPTGKNISFIVKEKPVIRTLSFSGLGKINEEDISEAANIKENTILNPLEIKKAADRIKAFYREKGYFNAQVKPELSFPVDGFVDVDFVIEEGDKVTIGKIDFIGNKFASDSDLKGVIETSSWNWFSWLTGSGSLEDSVLQQDVSRIKDYYSNHGFLDVKVGEPEVSQKDGELEVVFPVEEGPRYRVGTVSIEGDLLKPEQELLSMLAIRKEDYLNRQVLRDDARKVMDLYIDEGYAFAEVLPGIAKSPSGKRVDINFKVDKGNLVYFDRVEIRGNTKTRDNVIRRDLAVKEGGLFEAKALRKSAQKLRRLGYFEEVKVQPVPGLSEDKMDVVVDVKEQSTGSFQIGGGYSSAENFVFMTKIEEANLFGTGNKLSLSLNLSGVSTRYNLNFTNPRFMDSDLSLGLDAYNWEKEYDDYTKTSWGGGVRFGQPLYERWYIFYGYAFDNTELSDFSPDASQIIIDSARLKTTSSVHLKFSRDTTNDRLVPTSGSVNSFTIREAGGWLGGDSEYTKVEGRTNWYFSIFEDVTLQGKLTAAQAFGDSDKLPVHERYYLGGIRSIRGFRASSISPLDPVTGEKIGGDKMWFGSVSVHFPLVKDIGFYGEVFTDFGNVYDVDDNWALDDYKRTAGLGALWISPLGPIRVAWGYNLDRQDGEDSSNWSFTMGGYF